MKKVSELSGSELDYWVARAERLEKGRSNWVAYSTAWAVGGPIIEREGISTEHIWHIDGRSPTQMWVAERNGVCSMVGKTPLVAAMRCYVAYKFGDEVDDRQTHNL